MGRRERGREDEGLKVVAIPRTRVVRWGALVREEEMERWREGGRLAVSLPWRSRPRAVASAGSDNERERRRRWLHVPCRPWRRVRGG
ncbi:hypothetical protein HAX54_044154 [Datura stramonium]|uniref:Uncharacterized protein n=1 Tax=Datura stramonium TaxID=4076 RepID=A0ABS8RR54_DATST|nr:hypothetical protein [Datura stramonium]